MSTLSDVRALIDSLWLDYTSLNPAAEQIHRLLRDRGERVINDHIALRTYDDPRVGIDVMAQAFTRAGYEPMGQYEFPDKALFARHYEHEDAGLPTVFISELRLDAFSEGLRSIVAGLLAQMSADAPKRAGFVAMGRPWALTSGQYETLRAESEYAAWVAAFGFRANHFTVDVNALVSFDDLASLNAFIAGHGFELNRAGGVIKGGPELGLEQSSTLAQSIAVDFQDGARDIPSTYYEFARRYVGEDGRVFRGFIAQSADKIFESTDSR